MIDEAFIYKYLIGDASEEEKKELLAWLKVSEENRVHFSEIKALWLTRHILGARKQQDYNVDKALYNLTMQIDRHERKNQNKRVIGRNNRIMAIVAVFLMIIGLSYYWGRSISKSEADAEWITVENSFVSDTIMEIQLSDGSMVWLNKNAKLSYISDFSKSKRLVRLEGMAFFDVVKDSLFSFSVETATCVVEVLGTSFSINTHAGNGLEETILMNGSVCLKELDGIDIVTLIPGQRAIYSPENKHIEIDAVDVNSLTSWRFGLVSMLDADIEEIIAKLEEIYDVQIQMETKKIEGRRYDFSFKKSKDIQNALSQLQFITGVPATTLSAK